MDLPEIEVPIQAISQSPADVLGYIAAICERCRVLDLRLTAVSDDRFRIRAAMEQLIQGINQNLGTHDHTDWELARMVERAEKSLED